MIIEFDNGKTIDVYEYVKEYFVSGNIIDIDLIKYIVKEHFDLTLINCKIKILNNEVAFETLDDKFSFMIT